MFPLYKKNSQKTSSTSSSTNSSSSPNHDDRLIIAARNGEKDKVEKLLNQHVTGKLESCNEVIETILNRFVNAVYASCKAEKELFRDLPKTHARKISSSITEYLQIAEMLLRQRRNDPYDKNGHKEITIAEIIRKSKWFNIEQRFQIKLMRSQTLTDNKPYFKDCWLSFLETIGNGKRGSNLRSLLQSRSGEFASKRANIYDAQVESSSDESPSDESSSSSSSPPIRL